MSAMGVHLSAIRRARDAIGAIPEINHPGALELRPGGAPWVAFLIGAPGSFAVVASGFPSLSTGPVDNPAPPTGPDDGTGM
jgi:hypothetical protein